MDLSSLNRPADQLITKKELVADKVPEKEVLLQEDIKELNQDRVYHTKIGFEGGQMPLQRRVPKFGFKNINRVAYKAINVSMLQALAERDNLEKIDRDILIAAGLLNKNELLKVLGDGSISAKLEITANAFSKSAIAAIEAAGGSVVVL